MPLRNCRVCGAMLHLNPEKKSGVCDACRRKSPARACLKCGLTLLSAAERLSNLCHRCGFVRVSCAACGRTLESAVEKAAARCNACRAEAERIPKVRIRR